MSYHPGRQFHVDAIYVLDADVSVPDTHHKGDVLAVSKDWWFYYAALHRAIPAHVWPRKGRDGTIRLFRDYWRSCEAFPDTPYLAAIIAAPKTQVR